MLVAISEPTEHALGSRAQKPRRSWTVAEAAEMASVARMSLFGARFCPPPVGNSTSTKPSQNANRSRKNISPKSPAARMAANVGRLAASAESRVRGAESFLSIIEQNTRQFFVQSERRPKKIIYLKFLPTEEHASRLRGGAHRLRRGGGGLDWRPQLVRRDLVGGCAARVSAVGFAPHHHRGIGHGACRSRRAGIARRRPCSAGHQRQRMDGSGRVRRRLCRRLCRRACCW